MACYSLLFLVLTLCFFPIFESRYTFDPEDCSSVKGEIFTRCGSACPATCSNYQDESRVCTYQCVIGCFCPDGKVRRESDGYCVEPEECEDQLDYEIKYTTFGPGACSSVKGEIFTGCGSACPATCSNYQDITRMCTLQCVVGCFCPDGKVRRESDGYCVEPEECEDQLINIL